MPNEVINPLPQATASFLTDTQEFMRKEDADRYADTTSRDFVVSGGLHTTAVAKVSDAFATVAYTELGNRVVQAAAAIDYEALGAADSDTAWVILSATDVDNIDQFVRVTGTAYFVDIASADQPLQPDDSTWLMKVTISGGAITEVEDLRVTKSIVTAEVGPSWHNLGRERTVDRTGVRDMSTLINSVLATGVDLYLPAGVYKVSNTVDGFSRRAQQLVGAGLSRTILEADPALAAPVILLYTDIATNAQLDFPKDYLAVRELMITGFFTAGSIGIRVDGVTHANIEYCYIGQVETGVRISRDDSDRGGFITGMKRCRIEQCMSPSLSAPTAGVGLIAINNSNHITIDSCVFSENNVLSVQLGDATTVNPSGVVFHHCDFESHNFNPSVNEYMIRLYNHSTVFESCRLEDHTSGSITTGVWVGPDARYVEGLNFHHTGGVWPPTFDPSFVGKAIYTNPAVTTAPWRFYGQDILVITPGTGLGNGAFTAQGRDNPNLSLTITNGGIYQMGDGTNVTDTGFQRGGVGLFTFLTDTSIDCRTNQNSIDMGIRTSVDVNGLTTWAPDTGNFHNVTSGGAVSIDTITPNGNCNWLIVRLNTNNITFVNGTGNLVLFGGADITPGGVGSLIFFQFFSGTWFGKAI